MKTLRALHLYLGCVFAPLLLFFALSGVWQAVFARSQKPGEESHTLALLSTLHTGHRLKAVDGGIDTLSSPWTQLLVVAMAAALLFSIVLGVVMAFRFGRARSAGWCLAAGVVVPFAFVLLAALD